MELGSWGLLFRNTEEATWECTRLCVCVCVQASAYAGTCGCALSGERKSEREAVRRHTGERWYVCEK